MCMGAAPRIRMNKLDATGRPTDRCLLPRTVGNWRSTISFNGPCWRATQTGHNCPHSPPHGDETTLVGHSRAQCHASASSTCSSLDTAPGREGVVRMHMDFVFQSSAAKMVSVGRSNPTLEVSRSMRVRHILIASHFRYPVVPQARISHLSNQRPVSWYGSMPHERAPPMNSG